MPVLSPPAPLRRATLSALPSTVSVPTYDVRRLRPGVVHVGVGRFHRAHQATYFDRLAQSGVSTAWGVVGAGLRGTATRDLLAGQDNLFTVVRAAGGVPSARVVGSMKDYLCVPRDRAALLRLLTGDSVQLVTLTVTAEVYAAALGGVAGRPSVFDVLVEALDARRRAGRRPFTVLACDNLPDSGGATARALAAAAHLRDPSGALPAWVERNVACPASVVDRITPPADGSLPATLASQFGIVDPCAVVAEEYSSWVVEDTFSSERPPLEEVGVRFVSDVEPWAQAKMRLLNGGHCAVGFLGTAAGHATSAEAMADPVIAAYVRDLLHDEVAPTLAAPPGLDVTTYTSSALRRIADPALADPLTRLSRRGSVRLPTYVVPSLRDALRDGRPTRRLTLLLAAWVHHLRAAGLGAEEALAQQLVPRARTAHRDARPLLRSTPGMADLASHPRFVVELQRAVRSLDAHGVHGALRLADQSTTGLTVLSRPAPTGVRPRPVRHEEPAA